MDQPIPSARELLTALTSTAHALALCMGNASRSLITRILVLRTIAAHGGRLRHVDIIRETGCSGPDLSVLLDRLVDDRLVEIRAVDAGTRPAPEPSPSEPPASRASLPPAAREAVITRSGRRVLEAIEARYDLRADLVFAPITPSERVFLLRLLDKIRVAAEAMWLRTRASLSRRALDDDGLWGDATTTASSDDDGPPSPEMRRADARMPLAYELAYEDAQVRFFVEMLEMLETVELADPGNGVRRTAAPAASAPLGVPIWTPPRPIPSS